MVVYLHWEGKGWYKLVEFCGQKHLFIAPFDQYANAEGTRYFHHLPEAETNSEGAYMLQASAL